MPYADFRRDDYNALSDDDFRALVRRFLTENHPEKIRHPAKRLHWDDAGAWYMILSAAGWLAPNWPREHGGMGLNPGKQLIYVEEFETYGAARTPDHGMMLLGPLLINYGSEAQKAHFLPKILSGEHIWCQGYSEPNAGSDLANLRTEAVLDGDEWVVNGQKIWTTLAGDADWIFCLVRTDKAGKKQEGISFLLIPLDTPGITIRPIINLELDDEFSEVFFDDVRVPRGNIVGEVNQGWTMAKNLLGFERSLADIRVLDLGRYIAAPFCAQMLANEGAEVIRVEPPEGASDREVMPLGTPGRGGLYLQVNAGKKSLTLDYARPEGRPLLEALIASADVVIVNLPQKALLKLRLDYDTVRAIKPDIILTTISAFDAEGADRDRVGFDGTGQALSGAMHLTGFGEAPTREAVSYVDYATGMAAGFATLSALIDRMRSGQGQHVKCSLMGTALTMINPMLMEEASGYRSRKPIGNRSPIAGPSDLFRAKDGWVMIQIIGDPMFSRWATMMNRPDLLTDPRFTSDSDRGENGAALSAIQQNWCASRTVAECLTDLAAARLPACPSLTPAETLRMEGFADYTTTLAPEGVAVPLVTRLVDTASSAKAPRALAPLLGADTASVLDRVGVTGEALTQLRQAGII